MNFEFIKSEIEKIAVFSQKDWELFSSFIEPHTLRKKEFLFSEGDVVKYLAFVQKGCIRYYLNDNKGDEHIVYFGFEGWWVGDMNSFFNRKPTIYYLQALEDTDLFMFNRENFTYAIENTTYGEFFREITKRSYMSMQKRYAESNTKSAEEKYLELLEKNPQIIQRIPQHYIASYLGIKPESLSRIRNKISGK